MKLIKSLMFWLVAIIIFFAVLIAAADNSAKVSLVFLGSSTFPLSISWWVLISFVLGVVITSLLNIWSNTRLRLAVRKARGQAEKVNLSLDKVKVAQARPDTKADTSATSGALPQTIGK